MTDSVQKVSHGRTFGLDAVRALAIMLVLFGHGKMLLREALPSLAALKGGFLGVELFFVLSGFLIGQILMKIFSRPVRLRDVRIFMLRRWLRTLPNYFLFLLLNLTVFAIFRPFEGVDWRYFLFLQNLAWRQPDFFNESWSLAVEEWFYLLMPLLLLAASFLPARDVRWRILPAVLAMLLLPLLFRAAEIAQHVPDYAVTIRQTVLFRLDSLAFGVLAAYIKHFHAGYWERYRTSCTGIAALLLLVLLYVNFTYSKEESDALKLFFLPTVSLVFALFMPWADSVKRYGNAQTGRVVEQISLWSYSLYLAHLPLLHAARKLEDILRAAGHDGLPFAVGIWMLWIAACLLLSAVVYRYFEKPLMDLRERF